MTKISITIEIEVTDIEAKWDSGDPSAGINAGWEVTGFGDLYVDDGVRTCIASLKDLRNYIVNEYHDELADAYAKEQP